MHEEAASEKKLWKMLRHPGEMLPEVTMMRRSGSLEVKYKDSKLLHSSTFVMPQIGLFSKFQTEIL